MNKDSIYISCDEVNWKSIKNPIEVDNLNKLRFIGNDEFGYIHFQSGGNTYRIQGIDIKPLSSGYELRSHYGSAPFLIKDELNMFGGYGIFEYRNDIIYFDNTKREWEKKIPVNAEKELPARRSDHYYFSDSTDLYICGGIKINPDKESAYSFPETAEDVWKYNFAQNSWKKLGKLHNTYNRPDFKYIQHENEILLINIKKDGLARDFELIFLDLKGNKETKYKQKNIGLLSDAYVSNGLAINYNSFTNKYFILIGKEANKSTPLFLTENEFVGEKTYEEEAYIPVENFYYFIIILVIVLLGGTSYYFYWKKKSKAPENFIEKINQMQEEIKKELTKEEFRILQTIISGYPEPASYAILLNCFEQTYGYEAQIKKLRTAIAHINKQLQQVLKIRKDILIQQKNESDRRIREIIFDPDLINHSNRNSE